MNGTALTQMGAVLWGWFDLAVVNGSGLLFPDLRGFGRAGSRKGVEATQIALHFRYSSATICATLETTKAAGRPLCNCKLLILLVLLNVGGSGRQGI